MTRTPTVQSPATLAEAYSILAERGEAVKIIAGGTDLMVLMNARLLDAAEFLDIWRVDELRGIAEEAGHLRIGALTTYTEMVRSPLIKKYVPSMIEASLTIGAIQIQNRGTIGGNIVNASPAGDSLPVLAAYNAEVETGSLSGARIVPFNKFYTGYRSTALAPGELVLAVRIPKLKDGERDYFCKVGTRRAQAISKIVMAARAKVSGDAIESISIGVGSVAPTVIRAHQTEELLAGKLITPEIIEQARQKISEEIAPITDLRSTEHYRRTVTGNILARFLKRLI